jgi:hypothetical protein
VCAIDGTLVIGSGVSRGYAEGIFRASSSSINFFSSDPPELMGRGSAMEENT